MTRKSGQAGQVQGMGGADWLVVLGLVLIGLAVLLAFGWAALLAYIGTVLVVLGLLVSVAVAVLLKRGK